jgi:hypothetical protein
MPTALSERDGHTVIGIYTVGKSNRRVTFLERRAAQIVAILRA